MRQTNKTSLAILGGLIVLLSLMSTQFLDLLGWLEYLHGYWYVFLALVFVSTLLGIFLIIYGSSSDSQSKKPLEYFNGIRPYKFIVTGILIFLSPIIVGLIIGADDGELFLISVPLATMMIVYGIFKNSFSFLKLILAIGIIVLSSYIYFWVLFFNFGSLPT